MCVGGGLRGRADETSSRSLNSRRRAGVDRNRKPRGDGWTIGGGEALQWTALTQGGDAAAMTSTTTTELQRGSESSAPDRVKSDCFAAGADAVCDAAAVARRRESPWRWLRIRLDSSTTSKVREASIHAEPTFFYADPRTALCPSLGRFTTATLQPCRSHPVAVLSRSASFSSSEESPRRRSEWSSKQNAKPETVLSARDSAPTVVPIRNRSTYYRNRVMIACANLDLSIQRAQYIILSPAVSTYSGLTSSHAPQYRLTSNSAFIHAKLATRAGTESSAGQADNARWLAHAPP